MKNKYLISIIVPNIELEFNLYVPSNKKVGTIKKYIISSIKDLSESNFNINENDVFFIDKETGVSYNNDVYVKDSGIKNGSKIIIM